jgi:hypothetical protein
MPYNEDEMTMAEMDTGRLPGGGHEHRPYVESASHRHAPGEPEHWHDEDGVSNLDVEVWD